MIDCPFCLVIANRAPATVVQQWHDAIAIVPLHPRVDGHVLVIPIIHVADALEDPLVTAQTMRRAAEYASRDCNLIILTSVGEAATQTVPHLHIHVVPRNPADELALPWWQKNTAPTLGDGGAYIRRTYRVPAYYGCPIARTGGKPGHIVGFDGGILLVQSGDAVVRIHPTNVTYLPENYDGSTQ